jgi:hypothetical protein
LLGPHQCSPNTLTQTIAPTLAGTDDDNRQMVDILTAGARRWSTGGRAGLSKRQSRRTAPSGEGGPPWILIWGTPMRIDPTWEDHFERVSAVPSDGTLSRPRRHRPAVREVVAEAGQLSELSRAGGKRRYPDDSRHQDSGAVYSYRTFRNASTEALDTAGQSIRVRNDGLTVRVVSVDSVLNQFRLWHATRGITMTVIVSLGPSRGAAEDGRVRLDSSKPCNRRASLPALKGFDEESEGSHRTQWRAR